MAFAATDDLELLVFATRADSSKYRRIPGKPRVALLVDGRSNREVDFQDAVAVTALGKARTAPAAQRSPDSTWRGIRAFARSCRRPSARSCAWTWRGTS